MVLQMTEKLLSQTGETMNDIKSATAAIKECARQ